MKNKTRILGFLAAGVVASTIMLAGCKNNAQTTTNGGQSSSLVTAQRVRRIILLILLKLLKNVLQMMPKQDIMLKEKLKNK